MANTYTLIASQTLSSNATSVTFSSIPATYKDLLLDISARSDFASDFDSIKVQFNTDTAGNYSSTRFLGSGGASSNATTGTFANSAPVLIGSINASTSTANTFGLVNSYIPNYLASSNKPLGTMAVTAIDTSQSANTTFVASLWRNTAAINQIVLSPVSGTNLVTNSTFYLYGIKNS